MQTSWDGERLRRTGTAMLRRHCPQLRQLCTAPLFTLGLHPGTDKINLVQRLVSRAVTVLFQDAQIIIDTPAFQLPSTTCSSSSFHPSALSGKAAKAIWNMKSLALLVTCSWAQAHTHMHTHFEKGFGRVRALYQHGLPAAPAHQRERRKSYFKYKIKGCFSP